MNSNFYRLRWTLCFLFLSCTALTSAESLAAEFELRDGDRVVFLGDGLIEQEQYTGWVEVMLTAAFPDRNVTFRNLGWSGDTPAGESRFGLSLLQAGREPSDEGWKQLQKQLELTQPNLLILGYGTSNVVDATEIEAFSRDYKRLITTAQSISPNVRFLFLSPLPPLGGTTTREQVERYETQISSIAKQTHSPYVDLSQIAPTMELRKDPIHLNSAGYRAVAGAISKQLNLPSSNWESSPYTDVLRTVILRKNEWWFHRSRPANMAYVFGFRKHEQGQNAVEIPQFDPLIAAEEVKIADLRSLQPTNLNETEPQLASKYAEFTEQPTPEFTIDDDWEITLWAQNPLLNKPIHMNFDPQGRLWLASSEAYPMIEVGQAAPDKVVVLEDTDGDGVADKSNVFAEGLLLPTGIAPGNGGVYVAQSTDLLFLKDTDGDGKADLKTRVLSGFGTEDTHHNLHTLRWGPDGRLYMNQSVYTRTDAETPFGVVRLKAGGGFRFDPRTMRMEIFFRGLWNSWGHQFDAYGQSFLSDGAGFAGMAYAFPGATFFPTPNARQQLGLISPGSWPKFASLEIIQGDSFPVDWQGSIITCDFRANRVTRFSLSEQDAGFVTKQENDLLRTSAPTFRPIDVKQGPDGALYIADWSNPIINHGEVDFRDSRRDRWHGRIWRVAWKGATPKPKTDFTQLSADALLASLTSPDSYTRDQARRVLVESSETTPTALGEWLVEQENPTTRLEALWLYQALNITHEGLLVELLNASDARIRAAATRVLSAWADPQAKPIQLVDTPTAMRLFETLVDDDHPRVRLEAVRGLARQQTAQSGIAALEVLKNPMDRFLEHALGLTVDELSTPLMNSIESGKWIANTPLREKQLEFVLTSIEPAIASRFLTQRLAAEPIAQNGDGPWIELIGKAGGVSELNQLFNQALQSGFDASATRRALQALADAQRLRKLRPNAGFQRFASLLSSTDSDIQLAAIDLAGEWKLKNQSEPIAALAAQPTANLEIRSAALNALRNIGGKDSSQALVRLAEQDAEPEIRRRAVISLAGMDPTQAVAPFFAILAQSESEQAALNLWRGVLNSKGMGKLLAAPLAQQSLPSIALDAGLRAAQDGGRSEPELLAAITPLAGKSMTTKLTPERIQQLVKLASGGDPTRGELLYRRPELACATCHAIGGVGGKVGPDMTSIGASAPLDYIVESLFDPNAKVKEGYHSIAVITEDDQVVTGVEIESTDDELIIRDANNKLVSIAQADIVAKKAGKSLMPMGVVDRLSQAEQVDLISFLAQLGKPGDYDASQGGVARLMEVFAGTHRIEQAGTESIIDGTRNEGWKSVQALVSGSVPKNILHDTTKQPINVALVHIYLRTKVEVANAGKVTFRTPVNASLWVDGKPVDGDSTFTTQLDAGQHIVLVRLDARDLPDEFRLESKDVAFLNE